MAPVNQKDTRLRALCVARQAYLSAHFASLFSDLDLETNGSLAVESTPGKGSTFTLTLPAEGTARPVESEEIPSDSRAEETPNKTPPENAAQGIRVA